MRRVIHGNEIGGNMKHQETKKLVVTGLLAAIVVVLQTFASAIRIGQFNLTLSLIPIIIGAILYGPAVGGFLGGVFGVVVIIGVLSGTEPMSTMMFETNPVMTVFLCMIKGIMAGVMSGLVYKALENKNELVATGAAAIIAPIMNTGIFSILVYTVFSDVLNHFAEALGFPNGGKFLLVGIIGTNFLFELFTNVIVVPVVARILKVVKV